MENKIYVRPRFRKLDSKDYMTFWESLRDARKINRHGLFVLLRDKELYKTSQNFMIGNGIAGFAICEEELISVHKNNKKAAESSVKHILPKIVRTAFKYGAKYGDCYGEFLANYYMKSGFIAVAKVPFDSLDDNPIDWDYAQFGKPYIYVMIRGVKNIDELDRLKKQNALAGIADVQARLRTFKIFDNAMKFRQEVYNKLKNYGYKKRLEIIKNL